MTVRDERGSDRPALPTTTFANLWHNWDFIEAPTPTAQQQKHPSWKRVTSYYLAPGLLLARWESPDTLIGVSFDNKTHYCLLDLDRLSQYYPDLDETSLDLILASLEAIGLVRPLLLRSSHSGGLHIYYPLPEPVSTWKLANLLANTLQDAGFTLKGGQLETFPNVKSWVPAGQGFSHYQAHRLPLQQGSVLLNRDLIPEGADLNRFLTQWQWCAAGQDRKLLTDSLATAKHRLTAPGPKGSALEYLQGLESTIRKGWIDFGQTNDLLSYIARLGYVFHHKVGKDLARFIADTAKQLPGYDRFCQHHHDLLKRSRDWARAIEKSSKYYPYTEASNRKAQAERKAPTNEERKQQAIARLRAVVSQLDAEGLLEPEITPRVKQLSEYGFSKETLYKEDYKPLWHPKVYQPCVIPVTASDPSVCENASSPAQISEPQQYQEITDPSLRSVGCSDGKKEIKSTPIRGVEGGNEKPVTAPPAAQSAPDCSLLSQLVVLAGGRGREMFEKLLKRTSPEKAQLAIESYREQMSRTAIANPLAFLANALRQGWVPNRSEQRPASRKRAQVSLPSDPARLNLPDVDPSSDDLPCVGMPDWFKQKHTASHQMRLI